MSGDNQSFQLGMDLPSSTIDKVGENKDMTNSPFALDI
jgi:hypothetical protein